MEQAELDHDGIQLVISLALSHPRFYYMEQ